MLSTVHHPVLRLTQARYKLKQKPTAVIDYISNMAGVDHSDQLFSKFVNTCASLTPGKMSTAKTSCARFGTFLTLSNRASRMNTSHTRRWQLMRPWSSSRVDWASNSLCMMSQSNLASSCGCLLMQWQHIATTWRFTPASTGDRSTNWWGCLHEWWSDWQSRFTISDMLSSLTISIPLLYSQSICQVRVLTCAGQCDPVILGILRNWSRPKLRSGNYPMVPQSGDSVRGWWPQCGKTREWSTTSPVPTHLTGRPTHLVQTRQPFHFPQNFLHLTALHSTRSNNSHSELFFHVSAFDSNFSQSPSSCLRLSKRQAFNQKLRQWEKTNMN